MKELNTIKSNSFFLEEINVKPIEFDKNDFQLRINLLLAKMKENNLKYIVIYGDREHFSNIEYFTGYDSRFEESVFVLEQNGETHIIVGNEGMGYSYKIPFDIKRHLYQNFSLQGQIKDKLVDLKDIFTQIGLKKSAKIGVVCTKYFETERFGNPEFIFDIPSYIIDDLRTVCGNENVTNTTKLVTGLPDGVRMKLHSAKEIAWAESASTTAANAIIAMLKNLKPGITGRELSQKANTSLDALPVFPMINFGSEAVSYGLTSPSERPLELGEVCGLCYAVRGALTSRVGVAAYDENSCNEYLKNLVEPFYGVHFLAMASWYEALSLNCEAGVLHDAVHNQKGIENNGIYLNCGHNIGTDEWSNSPVYKNSKLPIINGTHLQVDIISSGSSPVRVSICEDGVVVASKEFREELKKEYPQTYERIIKRQDFMRNVLGINIKDEILPLSNLNGVFFPYMLNLNEIFAIKTLNFINYD